MRSAENGFTLIELLVTIAILGVLSALAIPAFAVYKAQAFDARAQSDLKNAITCQEATYVDQGTYATCADAACEPALEGYVLSPELKINCIAQEGGESFQCSVRHPSGTLTYYYNSAVSAFWQIP